MYLADEAGRKAFFEEIKGAIPLRALGQPEEVAALVAFLCSADAAWMRAQALYLAAGAEARRRPGDQGAALPGAARSGPRRGRAERRPGRRPLEPRGPGAARARAQDPLRVGAVHR